VDWGLGRGGFEQGEAVQVAGPGRA